MCMYNSGAGITVSQQRFLCLTVVCAAGHYLYVHACAAATLFLGIPYVCVPVGVFGSLHWESVQLSACLVCLPCF